MRLLVDTHILIWATSAPLRLPARAKSSLEDRAVQPVFSVASIWETAIKESLGRRGLPLRAARLREVLTAQGWEELPILAEHAIRVAGLSTDGHADPFDRMLIAQAIHENVPLMTADAALARYPAPVMVV